MSLHLFREVGMSVSAFNGNETSSRRDESSDSESSSQSGVVFRLKNELKMKRNELAKLKKNYKELDSQLRQIEERNFLLERDGEDKSKALHRAESKIKELEALWEKLSDEKNDLEDRLGEASSRERKLTFVLEVCEKKCSRLALEKSQLEEKIAQMEEDARRAQQNALNAEQLLAELDLMRGKYMDLRTDYVAEKERNRHIFEEIEGIEESPDRSIFDQFDWSTDGINLNRELNVFGSPFTTTIFQSEETQTDVIPVASSSTLTENMTCTAAIPISCAFVQTECNDCAQRTTFSAATQTTYPDPGDGSGTPPAYVPIQPSLYSTPNFAQQDYEYVGRSRANRVLLWIWLPVFLCFIVSIWRNVGKLNVTPIVDLFRNRLKFLPDGFPPH